MDILKDKIVVAKKQHICDLCGSKIETGESYRYVVDTFDGFSANKYHLCCNQAITKTFNEWEMCGEHEDYYLTSWILEHIEDRLHSKGIITATMTDKEKVEEFLKLGKYEIPRL